MIFESLDLSLLLVIELTDKQVQLVERTRELHERSGRAGCLCKSDLRFDRKPPLI
jgi:hypothetical protein